MKRLFVIAIKANILAGKGTITSITNCPGPMPTTFSLHIFFISKGGTIYESFSDVGEIRVYFASKILTPCRMH